MPTKTDSCLKRLLHYDLTKPGTVVGVDEVGRGCLAGPVVAAALIMPLTPLSDELTEQLHDLDDSKRLNEHQRQALSSVLQKHCRFGIGLATVKEIDRLNILQATFLAMRRALKALTPPGDCLVVVDGNKPIPNCCYRQESVIKGDSQSAAIAAASIVAKVYRDELMCKLSTKHPQYNWSSNKGYGSKEHRAAIAEFGLTALHRRKFCQDLPELLPQQLTILN